MKIKIMKLNRKTIILWSVGAIVGAFFGYLYFFYYGCQNGCAITSKPLNSSLYGAFMGALLFSFFDKDSVKK